MGRSKSGERGGIEWGGRPLSEIHGSTSENHNVCIFVQWLDRILKVKYCLE